jgi:uncharacterized phage protein (TIGR02218 family)
MRSGTSDFLALIDKEHTTLCRILTIMRTDGAILRFTDCTHDVVFDGETFQAGYSFTCSAIQVSLDSSAFQSATLEVIMDDTGFKETDLLSRRFDDATADIRLIDYEDPDAGSFRYLMAIFGDIKVTDRLRATINLTPIADGSSTFAGTLPWQNYSKTCRATFCDERCKLDLDDYKSTMVVETVAGLNIHDTAHSEAAAWWAGGKIVWTTGANQGLTSYVRASAPTLLQLVALPLGGEIAVGDEGDLFRGCDKLLATCYARGNHKNFRGEPFLPDKVTVQLWQGPTLDRAL